MKPVPLVRRTRLRYRSAKTAKVYSDERRPLVARLLDERPICQRCDQAASQDVHELKSRARGGSIVDAANCVCLCRKCHDLITAGRDLRFQRHSWDEAA